MRWKLRRLMPSLTAAAAVVSNVGTDNPSNVGVTYMGLYWR